MKGVITLKPSERSFQFKKNYVEMRRAGKSVHEIADIHHLSQRHAYKLIHDLADELGVPYESLLNHPHSPHILMSSGRMIKPVERVDFSDFEREVREGTSMFDRTLYQMDEVLKKWPVMPEDLAERGR